jgi:hypothetical protein
LKRDSEFPTMALPADQVAELQKKALGDLGAPDKKDKSHAGEHEELIVNVQHGELLSTTDERPALDFNDETVARPFEIPKPDDDEDVVVVDDIAEVVEDDEEPPQPRSSMPPPIPRTRS